PPPNADGCRREWRLAFLLPFQNRATTPQSIPPCAASRHSCDFQFHQAAGLRRQHFAASVGRIRRSGRRTWACWKRNLTLRSAVCEREANFEVLPLNMAKSILKWNID